MEMKNFNARGQAENPTRLVLVHPQTGKDLSDDPKKAPAVWVYGFAARSVQEKLADLGRKKMMHPTAADEKSVTSLESLFQDSIDTAMAYIERFENCEIEGKPIKTDQDARALLEFTFPFFGERKNTDGTLVLGANGQPIREIVNRPFSKQINDYVESRGNA